MSCHVIPCHTMSYHVYIMSYTLLIRFGPIWTCCIIFLGASPYIYPISLLSCIHRAYYCDITIHLPYITTIIAITYYVLCIIANKIDPAADIDIINTELCLADLESLEKQVQRLKRAVKGGDKVAASQMALIEKITPHLEQAKPIRSIALSDEELEVLPGLHMLTGKPTMFIANVAEEGFENNPHLDVVRAIAEQENAIVVPICSVLEADIAELDDEDDITMFLEEMGMTEPGLNRVIRAGYELLGLQTYFTAGEKEVRAWTIPVGSTAPQAAGVIHTDFERGFIRAETMSYDDFIANNGESGCKDAGKLRAEGKDYVVKDGDLLNFLFNV